MRRSDLRRLLRLTPEFKSWLLKDSMRAIEVRTDPGKTKDLYKKWKQESRIKALNLANITEQSKRASSMLNDVQAIMEMMVAEQKGKKPD
ncbi:hypothetical protein EDM56_27640 [Brevibacillus fluminis]|uniref:Uncharacterized protein n=1 Tax=Brevibacillus fluminis TaxID=511487 RepID=A0A3M8CZ82_9BACL|nr:hypothetical protein [Brevibacillus fluminis]RNB80185.1 hypothetical protein EDM56_27640 [Brevibacillus fluminis]